jgi:hypothetical protein
MSDYLAGCLTGCVIGALVLWLNLRGKFRQNPKPARSILQVIDRQLLRIEHFQQALSSLMYWMDRLSSLMYWMDRAREGKEFSDVDLMRFNALWDECNQLVDGGGQCPSP